MVKVTDAALQQAAGEEWMLFHPVFTDAYKGDRRRTADTMPLRRTAFVAGVSNIRDGNSWKIWLLPGNFKTDMVAISL